MIHSIYLAQLSSLTILFYNIRELLLNLFQNRKPQPLYGHYQDEPVLTGNHSSETLLMATDTLGLGTALLDSVIHTIPISIPRQKLWTTARDH